MHPKEIREALEKQPFEPFAVVTGDGQKVDIKSREFAFLHPNGRTFQIVEPKGKDDYVTHYVDVFLITKLMSLPKKTGKKRRKAS